MRAREVGSLKTIATAALGQSATGGAALAEKRFMMTALDLVVPAPALVEVDSIDLAASPARAWEVIRHGNFGESPLVHALFAVRTLPDRLAGRATGPILLRIDDMRSSREHPGFQVLADDGQSEVVVAAIGKVWHLEIPFVHVQDAEAFRTFNEPGYVKVAWAIRVEGRGEGSRVTIEVRVDATDTHSWTKFRRYFALVGPGSHFIRRSMLSSLAHELGTPDSSEETRALPGDELLPDSHVQMTEGVTIRARPEAIWPWLVEMDDGFEVLAVAPERHLILGGLFDADAKKQRPFTATRPEHFWHVTWSFVLEPLDAGTTRLHVRARASYPTTGRLRAEWIRPVHRLMQSAQLRHLAARAEGTLARDDWRDVTSGIGGAAIMVAGLLTPFQRDARSHWGLDPEAANRAYPGDELVASPGWGWTHGIEIDAPVQEVWPWVEQLGADRGGFYSYQWLENVVGCDLRNAETTHREWTVSEGDAFQLHPKAPPLRVAQVERGRFFVVHGPADAGAREAGKPWAEVSWLFFLEAIGPGRCRLVSRYRCATSHDLATRLTLGPTFIEPIGFAMDRRMLLGVRSRVEAASAKKRRPLRARRA